ncbi:hypothetical protein OVA24_09195 [Luteolibacter sp. SL250]|uniref:hypothetical protein n=1 Tax=Luteolibacter sp. SL250 TaxID=2995170 RepID=UPI00226DC30B|nr:hypothetical protein [Luteolibacter sp. SL250]WAC21558.1 hypothetical protein OVA24_09195 [Luteolibacter sp. SL250]
MKNPLFLILAVAACGAVSAQQDRVPSGLRPLPPKEPRKPNEVTVVLDPPAPSRTPAVEEPSPPALIENASSLPAPEADEPATPAPADKKPSVKVRVEKLQGADGPVEPGDVKLLFPFPAKPLSSIPKGWKLDSSESAPPFTRDVEISPGSTIPLSIRPHVLVPDTDGATTFTISEPGYQAALGYQQKDTVGAILSNSVRQLEEDSLQMGFAIERLQQLLVSLPRAPEPEATEKPPVAKPIPRK